MIKSLWDFTRVIWMNARRSAPAVRLPPTQAEQQIDLSFELACRGCYIHPAPVTDPKILKGRAEDYVSAPSSFIANAHNELWRFIREKTTCRKKVRRIGRGAAPPPLPPWIRHCPAPWYYRPTEGMKLSPHEVSDVHCAVHGYSKLCIVVITIKNTCSASSIVRPPKPGTHTHKKSATCVVEKVLRNVYRQASFSNFS